MSLFDILKNADFGAALDMIANQARGGMQSMQQAPGGLGGLIGAGTLGAVLGNVMSKNVVKGVALAGASAVAWNFFKKWSAMQDEKAAREEAADRGLPGNDWQTQSLPSSNTFGRQSAQVDPTTELVLRSMIYAAKADGRIDAIEQQRINEIVTNLLPGGNVQEVVTEISQESVDPAKIANLVRSRDQAEDVYRLSCAVIDIDEFMERNYLGALAQALKIDADTQKSLEAEADMARKQLVASLPR